MSRVTYKGIEFQENWKGTFEDFKSQFETTHVFLGIEPKARLVEMKKAFALLVKDQPKK